MAFGNPYPDPYRPPPQPSGATPAPQGGPPSASPLATGGGFHPAAPAGPSWTPRPGTGPVDYGQNYNPAGLTPTQQGLEGWRTSAPEWGGQYGLANKVAAQYGQQGADYAHRQIGNDLSNPYRMQQGATRGLQYDAMAQQQQAAMGNAPSAAAIGQGVGLNDAAQMQARAAALGGAANAMHAGSAAGMSALGQAAQGRAGETAQATQGWLGSAANIRGGDQNAFGLDSSREMQQAEMNQRMQLGSQGMANQIMLDQLGANTSTYGAQLGFQTQSELAAARRAYENQNAMVGGLGSAAAGGLSAYASAQGQPQPGKGG